MKASWGYKGEIGNYRCGMKLAIVKINQKDTK